MPTAPAPAETTPPDTSPAIASRLPDTGTATLRTLLNRRLVGTAPAGPPAPAAGLNKAAFTSSI